MANETVYKLPLRDGETEEQTVTTRAVDPLLGVRVALFSNIKRPEPPVQKMTMPDGSVKEELLRNDPAFREQLKAWRQELSNLVARATLSNGITSDPAVLEGRSAETVRDVLNEITKKSGPTEAGVAAVMNLVSPILVELLMAAKYFGMSDPLRVLGYDVAAQNFLIASFRYAIDNAPRQQTRQPAAPPPPIEAAKFTGTALPSDWM